MPFWSQRKVLTIPYKASTPFKSLGITGKSVSDKKKLLQFLVRKRQLSVVIRWAPALVSPINNLLSLSRVSFCREGSLFGTDLEKLPINWLRPHTHTVSGKAIYTRVSHFQLSKDLSPRLQIAFSAGLDDSSSPSCVDIFPKLICGPCGAPNLPRLLMVPIPNRSRSLNTHPLIDDFVRKLCGGGAPVSTSIPADER